MSEKRVCSASRSFAPLIGLFAAPNRPRNAPNSKIPLRKPLFQADSMRLWRIHSAKGAFTLSIDLKRQGQKKAEGKDMVQFHNGFTH